MQREVQKGGLHTVVQLLHLGFKNYSKKEEIDCL